MGPSLDPFPGDGCIDDTFESGCGDLRPLKRRTTHLRYPGGCNAAGGDPRTAGPSAALTPCGHVSTGWTCISDCELVGPRLGLRYVENGNWEDANSLWGRMCDGPPGERARGAALAQLRQGWRARTRRPPCAGRPGWVCSRPTSVPDGTPTSPGS
ncbi:MAG: hypothetical protein FJ086_16905 [Deltaproteobacteria bacterium]|nr:hypothetical protein [Deltaproteobacteria bacterium]